MERPFALTKACERSSGRGRTTRSNGQHEIKSPVWRRDGGSMPMRRYGLAAAALITILVLATAPANASWALIDPVHYAGRCPIIITGEIVNIDPPRVDQRQGTINTADDERNRVYDVAHIKVAKVHKSVLSDVKVEVGGEFLARMHSTTDRTVTSNDLKYPVGTRAIWLIYLAGDGAFYISKRPEQQQSVKAELALDRAGAFQVRAVRRTRPTSAEWAANTKKAEDAAREHVKRKLSVPRLWRGSSRRHSPTASRTRRDLPPSWSPTRICEQRSLATWSTEPVPMPKPARLWAST